MDSDSKIYVSGHKGLVGSSIVEKLISKGHTNIITATREEVDLTNQKSVEEFFEKEKPEYVFLAAAKVGGIVANRDHPAEFIRDNLLIQTNIIDASYRHGAKKLLFLGSSCIYPKHPNIPITEDQLMSGPLEPTNDAYAIAKIAGLRMCRAYKEQYGFNAISLMPTNLYGPRDNFKPESSHVIPSIMRRVHNAKENGYEYIDCWGDGSPLREFLYIDDFSEACYTCMLQYNEEEFINIGSETDISIKDLTEIIVKVVGYTGKINWDTTKPNGTPRKLMDSSKIKSIGWKPQVNLQEGLEKTYEWFKGNCK
jgi:GDP-L-fucose synthase